MKETLRLGLILLVITVVSAGVLAVSNDLTKDVIEELRIAESLKALEGIFGDGNEFKAIDGNELVDLVGDEPIVEVTEVYKADNLEGYAIKTVTAGYGGDLVVLTGISENEGQILGMRLLENKETKGIGTKAAEPEYESEFTGISLEEEAYEVITGATITSKGVLNGVNTAREFYNNKLAN